MFKELFESVTNFEIEEKINVFDDSEDPQQAKILQQYVLGFLIHKPNEIISHRECSAGERKIIKSFSTLLNKEYTPKIILIDNVEMHVESSRHLELIKSIKKCFPESQIFATTHSYNISRLGKKEELYDLRLVNTSSLIKKEPWRLYIVDEIKDAIFKLKSMTITNSYKIENMIKQGEEIVGCCLKNDKSFLYNNQIVSKIEVFLTDVMKLYLSDILKDS